MGAWGAWRRWRSQWRSCCSRSKWFRIFVNDQHILVDGRAVAATARVPGCAPFRACSLYLFHSQRLSEANLEILSTGGEFLEGVG
eukprot:4059520-Pyramimonas_sp.AAC.1